MHIKTVDEPISSFPVFDLKTEPISLLQPCAVENDFDFSHLII